MSYVVLPERILKDTITNYTAEISHNTTIQIFLTSLLTIFFFYLISTIVERMLKVSKYKTFSVCCYFYGQVLVLSAILFAINFFLIRNGFENNWYVIYFSSFSDSISKIFSYLGSSREMSIGLAIMYNSASVLLLSMFWITLYISTLARPPFRLNLKKHFIIIFIFICTLFFDVCSRIIDVQIIKVLNFSEDMTFCRGATAFIRDDRFLINTKFTNHTSETLNIGGVSFGLLENLDTEKPIIKNDNIMSEDTNRITKRIILEHYFGWTLENREYMVNPLPREKLAVPWNSILAKSNESILELLVNDGSGLTLASGASSVVSLSANIDTIKPFSLLKSIHFLTLENGYSIECFPSSKSKDIVIPLYFQYKK